MSNRFTASFHIERADYHMSFHIIPAWICKQYSEAYFEERGVNMIRSAVDSRGRQVLMAIGLRLIPPDGRSEIYATDTACIR